MYSELPTSGLPRCLPVGNPEVGNLEDNLSYRPLFWIKAQGSQEFIKTSGFLKVTMTIRTFQKCMIGDDGIQLKIESSWLLLLLQYLTCLTLSNDVATYIRDCLHWAFGIKIVVASKLSPEKHICQSCAQEEVQSGEDKMKLNPYQNSEIGCKFDQPWFSSWLYFDGE